MYALPTHLQSRLGNETLLLLADDNNDGAPDSSVINAALLKATAEIDAAIAPRYAIPVSPVPDHLTWICVSLAVPVLYSRRRDPLPEEHESQWQSAVDFLEAVKAGETTLPGVCPADLPRSTTTDQPKHFSRSALSDF